jgi:hypothetical protein
VQIVSEFFYRFTHKELRPLILQMAIANYLVFVSMHRLIRPRKEEFKGMGSPQKLNVVLILIHVLFICIFAMIIVERHSLGTDCTKSVKYPRIVFYMDGLMLLLYLLSWVCHRMKWFKLWTCTDDQAKIDQMPDEQQKLRNAFQLEYKKLFE